MRILKAVSREDGGITLAEISRRAGLPTATAQRLVDTLLTEGLLSRRDKKYALGPFAFELGKRAELSMSLPSLAKPFLERLREETGENANLAVLDGTEVVYLACAESPRMMRTFTVPGARVAAHATGVGKVLLASLDGTRIDALYQGKPLTRYTAKTIVDLDELKGHLETARKEGFALDEGEREEDVVCVAAPVLDHSGKVVAAISVSGPSYRLNPENLEQVKERVMACALEFSIYLGYERPSESSKARDLAKT